MFIDICEIKNEYRGADRDLNSKFFCITGNNKLDYELYCEFCSYNLEFNGEEVIIKKRLNLLNELLKKNKNIELIIFDKNPIDFYKNLKFLGVDVLNEFFESPLSSDNDDFYLKNKIILNENRLFSDYKSAENSLKYKSLDNAKNLLNSYYIYRVLN